MDKNHSWAGRIYMNSGAVKRLCTNCGSIKDAQNSDRSCKSPVEGATIWNMLTGADKIAAAIRSAADE
jgi:hypothetical protein